MAKLVVILFPPPPQSQAEQIAELAKYKLSTLYMMRRIALDEGDRDWAALIDEAARWKLSGLCDLN